MMNIDRMMPFCNLFMERPSYFPKVFPEMFPKMSSLLRFS